MKVFDRIGVGNAVRHAAPKLPLDYITWCASLAGREIGRLDLRGGSKDGSDVWTNCPQNLLEPILLERARRESVAKVIRGAECIAAEQRRCSVRATIRSRDGRERTIEADWMIAADGASSPLRRLLDIPIIGPGPQGHFFMVHFEADLRPWIEHRSSPIFWIMNPESSGTLIVHDPAKSHVLMLLIRGEQREEDTVPDRVQRALGTSVPFHFHSIDRWSPHVQVAERYRKGRVFLAGDAVHRFSPTGGLGLNTGVIEVDYLIEQLALVVNGRAAHEELDRYEAACRPAAQANATASLENMIRLAEVSKALGDTRSLAELERRIDALDAEERTRLDRAIEGQRSHFLSDGRLPGRGEDQ